MDGLPAASIRHHRTGGRGWIFFWTFPPDRGWRRLLDRFRVVRAFELLAIAGIVSITGFHLLASLLDMPALWRLLVFVQGWPYFVVFGLASIPIKSLPLLVIMLRKLDQLIRQQAIVMLSGLLLGLSGWYLFLWAPTAVHPGSSKR